MKYLFFLVIAVLFMAVPSESYGKGKPAKKSKVEAKEKKVSFKDIKSVEELEALYKIEHSNKDLKKLKLKTVELGRKSVPLLIKVMKENTYPDKNRWAATFLLGQIMGKKSSAFIAKFCEHPSWILRLASLKTLLALRQSQYKGLYAKMLKDKSMIVKTQALENIRHFKLKELGPSVWAMLYDRSNYAGLKGKMKRTSVIKDVIKTVGDIKFEKAKAPLLKMVQNDKYKDVFTEIDSSLEKIIGKNSPAGNENKKRHYWSRVSLSEVTL